MTAVDRLGRRRSVGPTEIEAGVRRALEEFDRDLFEKAKAEFAGAFRIAATLAELAGSTHVRVVPWCGSEECGHAIEQAIDGALLGTPEAPLPIPVGEPGPCVACRSTASSRWALAGHPL